MADFLRLSTQGSIVILAVAALRLVLKKAPKRLICLLWLLAGLRLLLPFQIESSLSLQPRQAAGVLPAVRQDDDYGEARGEILDAEGNLLAGKPLESSPGRGEISDSEGNVLAEKPLKDPSGRDEILDDQGQQIIGTTNKTDWTNFLPYIWLLGVAAMGASSVAAYLRLKKRVRDSVVLEEGVWVTGSIDTAFVLGFFRPRIYLPVWLEEGHREFVLAHERSHIARRDHWWKLLGYVALSLHWFNPIVWLGYILLCRDLEMACDENVVKAMDLSRRKAYSAALVSCSAVHHTIAACPVAFGEICVKKRVKNVLNFKKPGFWITLAAVLAAISVAVFLLTSPGMTMEEKVTESLYEQLDKLQAADDVHFEISIKLAGEYDYYTGQEQEFWKHGDDWYRVIEMETREGTYWEHYLQAGDIQYVSRDSEQIPRLESLDWQIMPEEYREEPYSLLTRNWREFKVLEVREEDGVYTVLIQDHLEGDSKVTYYEHTHAFQLDENYQLVGLVEYSKADKYMDGHDGTAGRFNMESWSEVRFMEADAEKNAGIISGVLEEILSSWDFDIFLGYVTIIEFDEAERQMIEQCREAVAEFQSRETVCMLVDNQFSGDILNDCSTGQYYQSGEDWLSVTTISGADGTDEWYAVEKDGEHYERYVGILHDPANGEGTDTGWLADVDGEPCIPWLRTVRWDDLQISSVTTETVGDQTHYTLHIQGAPYEMEETVLEYRVDFIFRGTKLVRVVLEYTKTWDMLGGETGTGYVVSTIDPDAAAPEDALPRIEAVYAQTKKS